MTATAGTLVHRTPLDFKGAVVAGVSALAFEEGAFKGSGTIESPILYADQPFNDLVGSWNADLPKGSTVEMQVQVVQNGKPTGWYRLGAWSDDGGRSFGDQKDAQGFVDVDTLKLNAPADAFRYRILMTGRAALKRVAVTYADSSRPAAATPFQRGPARRELKLPPRTQTEEQEKYRHDICSPTSLAAVLDFWGKKLETITVAQAVQDRTSDLYGNWPLNVAAAGLWGLQGEVARIDFERLEAEIAAGRPAIVSISAEPGELRGAPYKKTSGHLIVVAGFNRSGDVIVMDPAAKTRRSARRVYRRKEFAKVWLVRKLGLAYVLGPQFPEPMQAGVAAADLMREPSELAAASDDEKRLSQILYGERVVALEAKGGWVRVQAIEQTHHNGKSWQDYEGWVRADQVVMDRSGLKPNAVVKTKRVALKPLTAPQEEIVLSMGTRLFVESVRDSTATVRLLDGREAETTAAALNMTGTANPPPRAYSRAAEAEDILMAAEQFLGDDYVWGGRSAVQPQKNWGVDCSGLVSLSYRTQWIDVPRDAQDQFLKAKRIRRKKLKAGDLVFLSRPGKPKEINHVMIYAGGENLIESRHSDGANRALKTNFAERLGIALSKIDSGDSAKDRTVYFGTFLH